MRRVAGRIKEKEKIAMALAPLLRTSYFRFYNSGS
jgi:hypothetical protein